MATIGEPHWCKDTIYPKVFLMRSVLQ